MKNVFLFSTLFILCSCSEILETAIDNAIPEPATLTISIKNNTQFNMEDPQIIMDGYTFYYQDIDPGYHSEGHSSPYAYSEAFIRVKINGKLFVYSPLVYDQNSIVTEGSYSYHVDILDYDQRKFSIKRIDD